MIRRSSFNLIEILLAIGIIAVGLSSAMGLFTSGLRVGSDVTASSYQPNVTQSLLSHLRVYLMNYGCESEAGKGWKNGSGADAYDKVFSKDALGTAPSLSDFDTTTAENKNAAVIASKPSAGKKGVFLCRQLTVINDVPVSTFSAIAEVRWINAPDDIEFADLPLSLKTSKKTDGKVDSKDSEGTDYAWDKCRRVFQVRLSYPAEAAPEAREMRYFRIETFNDRYDRFSCGRANAKPE